MKKRSCQVPPCVHVVLLGNFVLCIYAQKWHISVRHEIIFFVPRQFDEGSASRTLSAKTLAKGSESVRLNGEGAPPGVYPPDFLFTKKLISLNAIWRLDGHF